MTEQSSGIAFDYVALRAAARKLAELAHAEDVGRGDITSGLAADRNVGRFRLLAKQPGVFAGREIAGTVLDVFAGSLAIDWSDAGVDGAILGEGHTVVGEIVGTVEAVLTAERTLLNFLQRLCGVATLTRRYVDAVAGTGASIYDTRKTTPGWRLLEKYAVRCGGGKNHRMGLHDAILIKDNHLAAFGQNRTGAAVFEMLSAAASLDPPPTFVEAEADTLSQVEQLLSVVGIDVVLLDNFALEDMRRAVELRDSLNLRGKVGLEASGGVTLDTVRAIAETGVDRISVGAITHSATAIDLSLERAAG